MSSIGIHEQNAQEVLDYDIEYDLTPGDEISQDPDKAPQITVEPAGLVIDSVFIASPRIKIWHSGGTPKVKYTVTALVQTNDGRRIQDAYTVKVTP